MNTDKGKLTLAVAIVIVPLLLSGCLFVVSVTQPAAATAGETITIQIQVRADLDPNARDTYTPYFGINHPNNWSPVGNPTYAGDYSGTAVYDASKTDYMEGHLANMATPGGSAEETQSLSPGLARQAPL